MAQSPIETAAGISRTWKTAGRLAWGYPFNYLRNVIEHSFYYTHFSKKVSNASATAIHGSITGSSAVQTITTSITNPDVPRVLTITIGGSGFSNDSIKIVGTNVEGKVITDTLAYTGTGLVTGSLVFKTVTSIICPSTLGASATVTVGTSNELGIVHRMNSGHATAIIVQDTNPEDHPASGTTNMPAVQAAPSSSNFDNQFVEKNWVVPATTPDGTTFLYIFYWQHKVQIQPVDDAPEWYSTTTSTSTSSTSTSSSTSSTSTSLSTSSTSISSTSSSTSSTSTSTTTLPI